MRITRGALKQIGVFLLIVMLVFGGFQSVRMIEQRKEAEWAAHRTMYETLAALQSARSQLYGAARTIEEGADAAKSIYELNEVRFRLYEARWNLEALDSGAFAVTGLHPIFFSLYEFDYYLHNELIFKWQEDPAALEGEDRTRAVNDLYTLHADLDELVKQIKPDERDRFDMETLGPNWEETLKRRVLEDQDSEFHQYMKKQNEG